MSHSLLDSSLPKPANNAKLPVCLVLLSSVAYQLSRATSYKIMSSRRREEARAKDRHCFTALLMPAAQQEPGSTGKLDQWPTFSSSLQLKRRAGTAVKKKKKTTENLCLPGGLL